MKQKKLTIKEILQIQKDLNECLKLDKSIPFHIIRSFKKNKVEIDAHCSMILEHMKEPEELIEREKERVKILDEFCKKDENGNPLLTKEQLGDKEVFKYEFCEEIGKEVENKILELYKKTEELEIQFKKRNSQEYMDSTIKIELHCVKYDKDISNLFIIPNSPLGRVLDLIVEEDN